MKINLKVFFKGLSYIEKLLKEEAPHNSPEIGHLNMVKGGLQRIRKKNWQKFSFNMGLSLCLEASTNPSFKRGNDNCIIYLDLFILLSFTWQLLPLRPNYIKVCRLKLENSTRLRYSSHFWFIKPIYSSSGAYTATKITIKGNLIEINKGKWLHH